jgi:hypothetical protein
MSLTSEDLRAELAQYPTKEDLRGQYPTKEDLRAELARYPTRDDLRADLANCATKDDLYSLKADVTVLREEMAQGFADLRRYMEMLAEDMKSHARVLFDGAVARAEIGDRALGSRLDDHGRRLDGLETQVAGLESRRRPRK